MVHNSTSNWFIDDMVSPQAAKDEKELVKAILDPRSPKTKDSSYPDDVQVRTEPNRKTSVEDDQTDGTDDMLL